MCVKPIMQILIHLTDMQFSLAPLNQIDYNPAGMGSLVNDSKNFCYICAIVCKQPALRNSSQQRMLLLRFWPGAFEKRRTENRHVAMR